MPDPKTPFLAVYDSGLAGVWVLIDAHDATEISRLYPELKVVPRPEWMTDALYADITRTSRYDVDAPKGWLGQLVDHRKPPAIERTVYRPGSEWPGFFVSLHGEWFPGSVGRWSGRATADARFVFALVTAVGSTVSWRKSAHSGCTDVPLSIVYSWQGPDERDVCVSFSLDSVEVSSASSSALPREGPPLHHTTKVMDGLLCEVTRVVGSPRLEFCVLFLAQDAVQLGDDGTWVIPSPSSSSATEQLLSILRGGRNGTL
jgi:hypothetical protein